MGKHITLFLLLLLVLIIFHSWFTPGLLSAYDFPFYSQLMIKDASLRLYAWNWHVGLDGFAGFFSPYSWVFPFIYIPQVVFGKYLGMDWAFIERVVYLYPLLILLILSPIYLFKTLFPNNKFYLISVIIYSFNTYSLLLAGGEAFVALAYSLIPIIFGLFYKFANDELLIADFRKGTKYSLILSLVLAVQIMLDPRVTYVTIFAVILYFIFHYVFLIRQKKIPNIKLVILYAFVIPLGVALLLHAFWILPSVFYGKNPVSALGSAYSTTEAVKYFSFAKLEQTISLLQQNWPENIFGKTYFMRWEFLLLPIIAYASLLFIKISKYSKNNLTIEQFNNRTIIFFALLGLLGAFLSKGANEPLGGIYLWMFDHIPGFIMFRDPAKWYPLVALSYSILIPFSIYSIYKWLSLKFKNYSSALFLILTASYLILLIYPALSGQLNGFFKKTTVPQDYVKLEKFLYDQPGFFRTLWFPFRQHFGYYSNTHPEISARTLFNTYDDKQLYKKFANPDTEKMLKEISVKYVIVPFDSEKEIFLTDRKYDNSKYKLTINNLQKISWLKQISIPQNGELGKIAVFELTNYKDHFWSPSKNMKISFNYINPTKYQVSINNANKGDHLVFSEAFDSKWSAKILKQDSRILSPIPYNLYPDINMNSFVLPENGNYPLEVYYEPQRWVDIGSGISLLSLTTVVIVLSGLLIYNYKH